MRAGGTKKRANGHFERAEGMNARARDARRGGVRSAPERPSRTRAPPKPVRAAHQRPSRSVDPRARAARRHTRRGRSQCARCRWSSRGPTLHCFFFGTQPLFPPCRSASGRACSCRAGRRYAPVRAGDAPGAPPLPLALRGCARAPLTPPPGVRPRMRRRARHLFARRAHCPRTACRTSSR